MKNLEEKGKEFDSSGLKGKTIIVTGGTRGIGASTALLLDEQGANVIITGRDSIKGKEVVGNAKNKNIRFFKVDLEKRNEAIKFGEWIFNELENLDILINNASSNSMFTYDTVPYEEWDRIIQLNMTSPFILSRFAARKMIRNRVKGKIINISAVQSFFPLKNSFAYIASKGGLVSLTRSLAADLGPFEISAMTVLPGPIYNKGDEVPDSYDNRSAALLGRMGRVREVANLLSFLCSDKASFMTGNEIVIDGGRTLSRMPDPEEISSGEY